MVSFLFSILSAVLLSGAFAPLALWWLAPLALGLHMYSLSRTKHVIGNVFLFGLVFNAIALHWTGIYVGSMPWIMLAFGQALFFLPLALTKKYGMVFYPLIFLIMEEIRARFPFGGFGWLRIAFSQSDSPYRAIAAFGGVTGLTAIVLILSWILYSIVAGERSLVILIAVLPLSLLLIPTNIAISGHTNALLVQGNVPQLGLDFNSRATAVFYMHVTESRKALKENSNVDFLLWPENAVDVDPFANPTVKATLDSFTKPIVLGAVIRSQGHFQNVSIAWTNKSQNIYVKQHLTPFGEYIPLRALATKISPFANNVVDFSPGTIPKVFTIKNAKIAPIICFELIDDKLVSTAAKSSNLIVVQTNSATFGISPESSQQLAITRIRAIEHGRNILSVSTTGISATVDYKGNILQRSPIHTNAHIFAQPGLITSQTPRDKAGDWARIGSFLWLIIVATTHRRRMDNRR